MTTTCDTAVRDASENPPLTPAGVSGEHAVSVDIGRAYLISQLVDAARDTLAHLVAHDAANAGVAREIAGELNDLLVEFTALLREPFRTSTAQRDLTITPSNDAAAVLYSAMKLAKWIDGHLDVKGYLIMQANQDQAIAMAAGDPTPAAAGDTGRHGSYV